MNIFARILKWNSNESRNSHGEWSRGGFDSFDDNTDDYDMPAPRYRGARPEEDYEEIKPRGAKKIYTKDPTDLASVFQQFKNDGCLMESHPTAMARKWEAVMGDIHPHDMLRAYLGKDGLSNHNMAQLAINVHEGDKRVSISTHGEESDLDVHGAKATAFSRFITTGEKKVAEHSLLKLVSSDQGGGVVKKMFKACLPIYDKLHLTDVTLAANADGGAYAWAKYGFEYFAPSDRKAHQAQMKAAISKYTTGKKLTEGAAAELEAVKKVLESPTNNSVWNLADMKTPHLDDQFKSSISKVFKKNGSFIKLLFRGADGKGSQWAGRLKLGNKSPARARLAKYIGS